MIFIGPKTSWLPPDNVEETPTQIFRGADEHRAFDAGDRGSNPGS